MTTASHAHDLHEHPPTVVPSAKMPMQKMGMLLFIGSEAALFLSLFFAYFFIRVVGAADFEPWFDAFGHAIPLDVALINSAILFSSSGTIIMAERALAKDNRSGMRNWLIVTILLGATFLGIQIFEYAELVMHDHIGPSNNAYSSVFFTITGFHGSHVFIGLLMLVVMLARTMRGHYSSDHDKHIGFKSMAWYWHFVDLVWVFVVSLIYLPGNLDQLF